MTTLEQGARDAQHRHELHWLPFGRQQTPLGPRGVQHPDDVLIGVHIDDTPYEVPPCVLRFRNWVQTSVSIPLLCVKYERCVAADRNWS